jgi:hypothetical protein
MDHDQEVTALSSEVQNLDVVSGSQRCVLSRRSAIVDVLLLLEPCADPLPPYSASQADQRLPDELLEMIAQEADFDELKSLALTNKWLS